MEGCGTTLPSTFNASSSTLFLILRLLVPTQSPVVCPFLRIRLSGSIELIGPDEVPAVPFPDFHGFRCGGSENAESQYRGKQD